MKIGIMQPYFMPYIGYWQRIHAVDRHVIFDDVNYIKRGWMNRNRIIINGNVQYFNVPVLGASQNKLINEVGINTDVHQQDKLMKTLEFAYKKSRFFESGMALFEPIIRSKIDNFAEYMAYEISQICDYLQIKTELKNSSDIVKDNTLKGQDKILEICQIEGGSIYYNALSGQELYHKEKFLEKGIELVFIRNAGRITYKQSVKEFIPSLSIIDVIMNCSQEEIAALLNDYELIEP